MFYYSVLPRADAKDCTAQATTGYLKAKPGVQIGGASFQRGQDQHGTICTESRDEVFTTLRGRSCLRFDLVVNTDVNTRLGNILQSVRIERK